jgi:hypothetical protein
MNVRLKNVHHGSRGRVLRWNATLLNYAQYSARLEHSVSWIVDTLLLDEDADESEERTKKVRESKREALEALAYVRDVLLSGSTDVDEERLMSEEEFKKRRRAQQEKEVQAATSTENPGRPSIKLSSRLPPVSKPALKFKPRMHRGRGQSPRIRRCRHRSSSFDSPRLERVEESEGIGTRCTSPGQDAKQGTVELHAIKLFFSAVRVFSGSAVISTVTKGVYRIDTTDGSGAEPATQPDTSISAKRSLGCITVERELLCTVQYFLVGCRNKIGNELCGL